MGRVSDAFNAHLSLKGEVIRAFAVHQVHRAMLEAMQQHRSFCRVEFAKSVVRWWMAS